MVLLRFGVGLGAGLSIGLLSASPSAQAFFGSSSTASSPVCRAHDPTDASVPPCPPRTGEKTQLIAENYYPAMAVSVTDQFGQDFFVSFVMKALRAQPDRPPQFLVSAGSGSMSELKAAIEKEAPDAKTRERWLSALTSISGKTWEWQQDFYQPGVDPKTGRPVLREATVFRETMASSPYFSWIPRIGNLIAGTPFENVAKAASDSCGIETGDEIPYSGSPQVGHKGGNIEATVGGLCLIGDAAFSNFQWTDLAEKSCGKASRALRVPTQFLASGHADEVIATIRAPNRKAPCDSVILLASPRAALDALAKDRQSPFLSFSGATEAQHAERYLSENLQYAYLCREVLGYLRAHPRTPQNPPAPARRNKKVTWLTMAVPTALAESAQETATGEDCTRITNGDVWDYFSKSKSDLAKTNELIQSQMDAFKTTLAKRLKAVQPACTPEIIDAPDLFTGHVYESGGTTRLGQAWSRSIFPNPTNSTQFGSTLIAPDPGNSAARADLKKKLDDLGVQLETIDTTALHSQVGNIHCATNVIRYCRPEAAK